MRKKDLFLFDLIRWVRLSAVGRECVQSIPLSPHILVSAGSRVRLASDRGCIGSPVKEGTVTVIIVAKGRKKKRAFKTVQQQREDNENKSAQRSQADDRKKSPPFVLETSSADDHRNESRRGKTTKAYKSAESLGFILFFSLFSACVDCHPFTIFQRKEHSTKQRFDKRPNTTRLKYSVEKTT